MIQYVLNDFAWRAHSSIFIFTHQWSLSFLNCRLLPSTIHPSPPPLNLLPLLLVLHQQGETTFEHQLASFVEAVQLARQRLRQQEDAVDKGQQLKQEEEVDKGKQDTKYHNGNAHYAQASIANMRMVDDIFHKAGLPVLVSD